MHGRRQPLCGANSFGTVFKITPSGSRTTIYSFCAQSSCTDGSYPEAGLVQGSDGDLYGTTLGGGVWGYGVVFKITPSGAVTTLYSFCSQISCYDGRGADAALIQATDGNLYGTTALGGANANSFGGYGTVFSITPSGTRFTLYSFCAQSLCTDGAYPYAGLVQATDGNLYGTTAGGGANGVGTVFQISPSGKLTILYSFCSQKNSNGGCTDGDIPYGGLVQGTNGTFYGTTEYGGAGGYGTGFSLSLGLGPFVKTQPASGKVGAAVKILGTHLGGTTSVTFNGTAAVFKVASRSLITTKVPSGATTGTVQVTTPNSTLSSNVPFQVLP